MGARSQFNQLPQGDLGGISTMWIDAAGTLPAGSQLTVLPAPDYHVSSPYIHAPQSRSTNAGPDLFRHLRLHTAEPK
ncbi:hypothetical protein BASA61_006298 [Batrachochytrium salamandrivorans]|nr:hypothetical protein BASA61_006298 [Batrachochytrium salamandrivorans]